MSPNHVLCNLWSVCMPSSYENNSLYFREGLLKDNFIYNTVSWKIMGVNYRKSIYMHVWEAKTLRGALQILQRHTTNCVSRRTCCACVDNQLEFMCGHLFACSSSPFDSWLLERKRRSWRYPGLGTKNELLLRFWREKKLIKLEIA